MFKTKDGHALDIERLTWREASQILSSLNPRLAKIIDDLDPDKSLYLYKVRYPFGHKIIYDLETYIPLTEGGHVAFNDADALPKELFDDLNYNQTVGSPLGVITDKNCEFYMPFGNRILPHMMISAGDIFGIARSLNNALPDDFKYHSSSPSTMWDLNSGSRSSFMLPKISDNTGHTKLKNMLALDIIKPESYQEHNEVFTHIAERSKSPWRSEVIFFSNKWQEKLKDPAWSDLYGYLSLVNRSFNKIWHNTPNWTAVYNEIEFAQRLGHHSSYVLGTARHLFTIAVGCAPGFRPATNEDSIPLNLIQEVYIDGYELTDHWPIIMEPAQFSYNYRDDPIYYSLNYPTLAQHNPSTYKGKSIISLEEDVESVIENYCNGILKSARALAPSLYNAAKMVEFSFYHNEHGNNRKNIKNNLDLPLEDPRFNCHHHPDASFPTHSPFLKGCIKIACRPKGEELVAE